MREITYRGYRIRYHSVAEWLAHIYRPGINRVMNDIVTATLEEGENVLLARVRARIEKEDDGDGESGSAEP